MLLFLGVKGFFDESADHQPQAVSFPKGHRTLDQSSWTVRTSVSSMGIQNRQNRKIVKNSTFLVWSKGSNKHTNHNYKDVF